MELVTYEINRKPDFEQLYKEYYSKILFYTIRKIGSRDDAEDLTSDIFFYCYDHYDNFDPDKSSVTTWLYMVTNSKIKNYYRDHKTHVDISELENLIESHGEEMDRAIYLQQLRDFLAKNISTLPERQQQIIILKFFKEKSSEEIAEELGITPVNARVLLSRALDKLESACREFIH